MRHTPRLLLTLLVTAGVVGALTAPADARGGGGGHGFGGGGGIGGGGGGLGHGFGGFHGIGFYGFGFGGGGGGFFTFILIAIVIYIAYRLYRAYRTRQQERLTLNTASDRTAHRSDKDAAARSSIVEGNLLLLADTEPTLNPDDLKVRVEYLYSTAQEAWSRNDTAMLRTILSPTLAAKWTDELAWYINHHQRNVVTIEAPLDIAIVNLQRPGDRAEDTVTCRVSARLRDYVIDDASGATLRRKDRSTNPVEYWTLGRGPTDEWIVVRIEQAEEGAHHLTDPLQTDFWNQQSVADQAILESSAAVTTNTGSDALSLTNISWSDDAEHAAEDLAVVDGRFGKDVIEVGIRRFINQWLANDGSLDGLRGTSVNRTVLRQAEIDRLQVQNLIQSTPPSFHVRAEATGFYYEVDRGSEAVVSGDPHRKRAIAFTFVLELTDEASDPWKVVAVQN